MTPSKKNLIRVLKAAKQLIHKHRDHPANYALHHLKMKVAQAEGKNHETVRTTL